MTTATAEKIYKEIEILKKETKTLKRLFFLVIKDSEGDYKDSFVKQIIKKSNLKPEFIFTGKTDFLKHLLLQ